MGFISFLFSGSFKIVSSSLTWHLGCLVIHFLESSLLYLQLSGNGLHLTGHTLGIIRAVSKTCHTWSLRVPQSPTSQILARCPQGHSQETLGILQLGESMPGSMFRMRQFRPFLPGDYPGNHFWPWRGREKPRRGDSYHRQKEEKVKTSTLAPTLR